MSTRTLCRATVGTNRSFLPGRIHEERFSICAFLNLCFSQLVLFSISVFLNLCDSQLVFFSICAILNLCDSQLLFFSIKAIWGRHPMLYFKIQRTKKCSIAMCYHVAAWMVNSDFRITVDFTFWRPAPRMQDFCEAESKHCRDHILGENGLLLERRCTLSWICLR